jgi:hypothetical protein
MAAGQAEFDNQMKSTIKPGVAMTLERWNKLFKIIQKAEGIGLSLDVLSGITLHNYTNWKKDQK